MLPDEIDILFSRVDTGFRDIIEKIDLLQRDFSSHLLICAGKFAGLNIRWKVQEVLRQEADKSKKEKLDWWKWIIRATVGAVLLDHIVKLIVKGF